MYRQQVNELYHIFSLLNQKVFNNSVVQPVITIQSKGKLAAFGWCSLNPIWKGKQDFHEINLSAEYMDRSLKEIVGTLLHECVHLDNILKGIKDCSRNGTYHNKRFEQTATKAGLVVESDKKYGYAHTSLNDEMIQWLNEQRIDKECFTIAREDTPMKATGEKTKMIKYKCPDCGNLVKATDEINIICMDCDTQFEMISSNKKEDDDND